MVNYCPSHDWDRYCNMTDPPEFCPVCGKPNWDEKTEEDVFPEDPSFCSAACRDQYVADERAAAEWEATELARAEADWNALEKGLRNGTKAKA